MNYNSHGTLGDFIDYARYIECQATNLYSYGPYKFSTAYRVKSAKKSQNVRKRKAALKHKNNKKRALRK